MSGRVGKADQALVVPTEPSSTVSALTGFDPSRNEVADALAWIVEQAQNGMSIACGCSITHGDDGGGLEMLNSILSDIGVNAARALAAIATEAQRVETVEQGSVHEGATAKPDCPTSPSVASPSQEQM